MTSASRSGRGGERWALAALTLLAFGWRVAGLTSQSLWRDEVDSIRFASRPLPELIATFARPGENGPLFFALLSPWLAVLGSSEFALRVQAALAGALAVPLVYALARRLVKTAGMGELRYGAGLTLANAPLLAALLVAANPYLVWYSQEGKMYGWLAVLALAVLLAFLAALQHSRWQRWLLYLLLLGVAALHHVWAVLLIPVCALWLALLWPDYRRRWLPFLLTLALPIVPYMALVGWWQLRLFTTPDFQTGHPFVPLHEVATTLAAAFSLGVARSPSLPVIAGLTFLLLAGSVLGGYAMTGAGAPFTWRRLRATAMLLAWLALPPLLLYLVALSKPLYTDRYVIWIALDCPGAVDSAGPRRGRVGVGVAAAGLDRAGRPAGCGPAGRLAADAHPHQVRLSRGSGLRRGAAPAGRPVAVPNPLQPHRLRVLRRPASAGHRRSLHEWRQQRSSSGRRNGSRHRPGAGCLAAGIRGRDVGPAASGAALAGGSR